MVGHRGSMETAPFRCLTDDFSLVSSLHVKDYREFAITVVVLYSDSRVRRPKQESASCVTCHLVLSSPGAKKGFYYICNRF